MEVPIDLVAEILSRLPIESLSRYIVARKAWRRLIQSSSFADLRWKNNNCVPKESVVFLRRWSPKLNLLYITGATSRLCTLKLQQDARLLGYSRGNVCLLLLNNGVVIQNPSMGYRREYCAPVTSMRPIELFGFGYVSLMDDYKVLRLFFQPQDNDYVLREAQILTLRSNTWRRMIPDFAGCTKTTDHGWYQLPILLNETLHWMFYESVEGAMIPKEVYSFTLGEEKDHKLGLPNPIKTRSTSQRAQLGVFRERLCLLCLTPRRSDHSMLDLDVWVMNEYGVDASWTKHSTILISWGGYDDGMRLLGVTSKEEIVVMRSGDYLVVISIKDGSTDLQSCGLECTYIWMFSFFSYQSLLILRKEHHPQPRTDLVAISTKDGTSRDFNMHRVPVFHRCSFLSNV